MKKPKKPVISTTAVRNATKGAVFLTLGLVTLGSWQGAVSFQKINSIKAQAEPVVQQVEKENFATSIGAQTFATNFVENYFTWNRDNYEEREERLKPYMREGFDGQAGLRMDSLAGNSSVEKIEIFKVSETGDKTSMIAFRVFHNITVLKETKIKGKLTRKEEKTGPHEKWIEVPVITDGNTFLIDGIPTFTNKPPVAEIEPFEKESQDIINDADVTAAAKDFLKTFFKQYSTGTKEELEFLTKDTDLLPLDGSIVFKDLETLSILEEKKNGYLIETQAIFTEPKSKVEFLQKYRMVVSEEDGRWQVIKFY